MAASTSKVSKHQENISVLMNRMKELAMDAETGADARIFSRIEGKKIISQKCHFLLKSNDKMNCCQ